MDALHPPSVHPREGGAPGGMAVHDGGEGLEQVGHPQRPGDAAAGIDVPGDQGRVVLVHPQQAFLVEGERPVADAAGAGDRRDGGRMARRGVGQLGLRLLGGEPFHIGEQLLQVHLVPFVARLDDRRRQGTRGGCFEQRGDRQLGAEVAAQVGHDLDGEERVAAQLQEVVVDADRRDAEQLLPDRGDRRLGLVARCHVGDGEGRARALGAARSRGRGAVGRRDLDARSGGCDRSRRGGRRIDPEPAALERIGGQRHPPAPGAAVEARPVDGDTGVPQLAHRAHQVVEVGAGAAGAAQGRHGDQVPGGVRMLAQEGAERAAGADFQVGAAVLAQQRAEPFGEAHGALHVARPVGGVGEIRGGDPGAGDVREVGDARRLDGHAGREGGERRGGGGHRRGVEGVGGLHLEAAHAAGAQPFGEGGDGVLGAADDAEVGPVGGGERERGVEVRPDLRFGERHGEQRARGQVLDQPRAPRHQGERVVEPQSAGEAGGDVLADAVADHRRGLDPPLHQQAGEGVFDDEAGRLCVGGLVESACRAVGVAAQQGAQIVLRPRRRRAPGAGGEQHGAQIRAEVGEEPLGAVIDLGAEERLGFIDLARHVHRLVAQAGEQKHHRAPGFAPRGRRRSTESRHRPREIAGHREAPVLEGLPAGLESPGKVRQGRQGRQGQQGQPCGACVLVDLVVLLVL